MILWRFKRLYRRCQSLLMYNNHCFSDFNEMRRNMIIHWSNYKHSDWENSVSIHRCVKLTWADIGLSCLVQSLPTFLVRCRWSEDSFRSKTLKQGFGSLRGILSWVHQKLHASVRFNKGGKFFKKMWYCVGGRV